MAAGISAGPLEGLMSVKPSRRLEDGGAMVGWTLLGCISDIGGLIDVESRGVFGAGGGDDRTALVVVGATSWATPWGLSLRSGREDRLCPPVVGLDSCQDH